MASSHPLANLHITRKRAFWKMRKAHEAFMIHQGQHLNPKDLKPCLDGKCPLKEGKYRFQRYSLALGVYYVAVQNLWDFEHKKKKGL